MTKSQDQFWGSMLGGAIGDAIGGEYENVEQSPKDPSIFVWGEPKKKNLAWRLSDDTQLSMATCESIIESNGAFPEKIAQKFLQWYKRGKLSGLGSATLQAIRGLENGGHWALVGKRGEQAAGNGAAMRIAPLAFMGTTIDKGLIRDLCRITHHNDEAYIGSLAVIIAIRSMLEPGSLPSNWLETITTQLPDTNIRDRIGKISKIDAKRPIPEVAEEFGNTGYVVDSIPLALFAVERSQKIGFEKAMDEIILSGGDTDTNASIFGQIAGAKMGYGKLPKHWVEELKKLNEYLWIKPVLNNWKYR